MSRHVLLNNEVMDFITTQLIGAEDNTQYRARPTEWADDNKSDVLYVTDNASAFPPILIKTQHVADDAFLHRVVRHCEEVNTEYGAAPVVLVFVVAKIRDGIMRKVTKDPKHSFLLKLACFPWAKKCMFLSGDSIRDHLTNTPLLPVVALGAFFTAQKLSIVDHPQGQDPTIQLLYSISKKIFDNIAINEKTASDDLLALCDQSESKIREGIKALEESTKTSTRKRAIGCLNDSLEIVKSYRFKYMPSESSPASLPASSTASSSTSLSLVSSLLSPSRRSATRNWEFVDNYIQSLGDGKMNWTACFVEGQSQGLFHSYNKPTSLKNVYQRWKKQQK